MATLKDFLSTNGVLFDSVEDADSLIRLEESTVQLDGLILARGDGRLHIFRGQPEEGRIVIREEDVVRVDEMNEQEGGVRLGAPRVLISVRQDAEIQVIRTMTADALDADVRHGSCECDGNWYAGCHCTENNCDPDEIFNCKKGIWSCSCGCQKKLPK